MEAIPGLDVDQEELAEICERNDIARLRLFGSYARGEEHQRSDIDLLADFTMPKSLLDLVRIERELSAHLGRKVDLLTENSLSPYLRDTVLRETKVVYEQAT